MNRVTRVVLRSEVRQLLRDRRALFAAVLLPALLYPLIFWSTAELERSGEAILEARQVSLAVDLSRVGGLADQARAGLVQRTPIQLFDVDAAALVEFEATEAGGLEAEAAAARRRKTYRDLLGASGHALVTASPHATVPSRSVFRVYFDVKDDDSREAADRAKEALGELDQRTTVARREALLGVDPARGLDLEPIDVASAEDTSGMKLGRFLPLIAVLVLLSGGSYAALAVFAGEREAGTLETLLVQPVDSRSVARGKFLAVLAAGLVTLVTNLGSLIACGLAGLGELPGLEAGGPGLARLLSGLVYLPGAVLLSALLCLVCGKARTFREGQQTIFPVMVLAAAPTAIVLQPGLETSALLAALPFAGAALVFRDALAGDLALMPLAVMVVAHAGWSWLALSRLGVLLDAERVLTSAGSEAEAGLRRASARHGMRWGFVSVLLMYVVGTRLQAWDLAWGLGLTLWGLVVGLALTAAWRARRRGGQGLVHELSLRPPQPALLVGALLCVPAVALGMTRGLMPWLLDVLPMPQSAQMDAAAAAISGWGVALLVFLLALSPGVCEELLFRGAVLTSLRRDLSATRAVLWQAFFFAMMHLSVYRLLPTFLLGVALGALTLRARSLWPAVLAHASYNALQVLAGSQHVGWAESAWWPWLALGALPGLALILGTRPRSD